MHIQLNQCVLSNQELGIWLYQANCLDVMNELITKHPNGRFDMIFADPPYFLSNGGTTCKNGKRAKVDKGEWDKSQGLENTHKFNLKWLTACQQLLLPNGTLWVSGTHHNIHSIGFIMQQLKMKILNNITWEKPNPPPNLSCRYFTHSTETILWGTKSNNSKHLFNYQAMRQENSGKQMQTVWKIKPPSKQEKTFGKHPTQKPIELLKRIILASTNEGDRVFDPFAGSSTTGVSALLTNRKFVGCELDARYAKLSVHRLNAEINKPSLPGFKLDRSSPKQLNQNSHFRIENNSEAFSEMSVTPD